MSEPLRIPHTKQCLLCERVLPFTEVYWPKRYTFRPLSPSNCQPRCRSCDSSYSRRMSAWKRAKRLMEERGMDPDRLKRVGPYYREVELDASRLSAREVAFVREALFSTYSRGDQSRSVLRVSRRTEGGTKILVKVDDLAEKKRPAVR